MTACKIARGVCLALSLLAASRVVGQSATTAPLGFAGIPLLANSDSLVSIPFTQAPVFAGAISSIAGNVITVANSPGWTANQYVYAAGKQSNTYYAIVGPNLLALTGTITCYNGSATVAGDQTTFTSQVAVGDELLINNVAYGVSAVASQTSLTLARVYAGTSAGELSATRDHSPREGSYYTVTANGSNTLTVNLNGDSLSQVVASTSVSLIPYWTLGTAFPAADAGISFTISPTAKSRGTQILLPDVTGIGINLAAASIYYFINGAWIIAGSTTAGTVYNDTILPPTNYFIVRNAATATAFTPAGGVYLNRLTVSLDTETSTTQDNAVAVPRPEGVALNDLGLIASGAFANSPSAKQRGDLLLTYDNTTAAYNKAANDIYYYYDGAWRLAGAPDATVDYGSTIIPYGVGLTVRKNATSSGATSFWQNTRNY